MFWFNEKPCIPLLMWNKYPFHRQDLRFTFFSFPAPLPLNVPYLRSFNAVYLWI
jgi:hypothetical protein